MKLLFVTLLFFPLLLSADAPTFAAPVHVLANGVPLTVSAHAAPSVVDWDGDGVKDLLVGQYTGGNIRLYINSGTNSSPVFTTYSYMQADGSIIQLPYG